LAQRFAGRVLEFWPIPMSSQKQLPAPPGIQIGSIHSFLVHPGKSALNPHEISGTEVPMSGVLFGMLKNVFDKAEEECQHNIAFAADDQGKQENDCRSLLLAYIEDSDLTHGREVAKRLQNVTTHRSRLGLMFLMKGQHKGETKLVVSRFPADSGIVAEEKEKSLSVEFLERIFMKSSTSYKAAVYSGKSYANDFWKGQAVDKQINSAESYISDYWIKDFLHSDFLTPGEAGTRRLAVAVRDAMNRSDDPQVKRDITALHHLIMGMPKKVINAKKILDQFQVSEKTKEQIKDVFSKAKAFEENFQFVPAEFLKHVFLRTVELDNSGLLTAPTESFDAVFTSKTVDKDKEVIRFTTEGKIVDQRFRKVKP
jgi:hypothetical protein